MGLLFDLMLPRNNYGADGTPSTTLNHSIKVSLFGNMVDLGSTWQQICQNLSQQSSCCSQKVLCAMKLCLMDRLEGEVYISEEERAAAIKEYCAAIKNS